MTQKLLAHQTTSQHRPPAVVTSFDPAAPHRQVTEVPASSAADAAEAVRTAGLAFPSWADATAGRRAQALHGAAAALAEDAAGIAALICAEEGKTLGAARGEVAKTVEQFRLAAQLAFMVEGATYPAESAGVSAWTLRVPLGVVVAVTPWNFPLSLAARKLAPALAAGNTVVFKPSPVTPGVGARLAAACHRGGVPEEALRVVQGDDPEAMAALVGAPEVRAVSFTGSDRTGALLHRTVRPGVRTQFELGGHNAALVCADAELAHAATEVAAGAFGLTGQVCTATDRVLVDRSVAAEFTELLAERTARLTVGPGEDPDAAMGPAATAAQRDRVAGLLDSALAAGARAVAHGGLIPGADPAGHWLLPTLLADVPADHPVLTAEVFGPLLSVVPVDGPDEALAALNADAHRLVTAVHTRDLGTTARFVRAARHGIVKVNQRTTGNGVAPPFGGWGASSSGAFPEGGRGALDFVTDTKTVYCDPLTGR
ncbi:aldehyde dehydrogenase family protein [Streptomyces endophyticus]|uniref:Aldehyde dehydrogenase family protein n=1 Tax=Streptomyces endophyticus TaxID=714166 RepID=A0ABU6FEN4_9ACTN|nr:aldehyde dehydrogenase family protein [Streptomyces endophyticus]MEB8342489.1 aldehyde dehydrogenase family protein [Streptomyces endophyticus]